MSELEKLIKELCPNGVEYVSIGSLIRKVTEKGKNDSTVTQVYVVSNSLGLVKAEEYREYTIHSEDTSNYTIVRPNAIAYNPARLNIGSIALNKSNLAGLVSPMYVVFDVDTSKILPEYLELIIKSKYILSKIDSLKEEGARFRFDFNRWDWIKIPLPPIEIQTKVFAMLSKFSNYISLLQSEYSARKKQYEHYRDKLLSFDDIRPADQTDNGGGYNYTVTYRKLGELCLDLTSGKNNSRSDSGQYIVYGSTGAIGKCDKYKYSGERLLVARVGANAGYVYAVDGEYDVSDNTLMVANVSGCNFKFLFHYLKNANLNQYAKSGGQPLITATQLKNIEIPVPPLETQKRIVGILDKFEMLANSLSDGLPAEIEARKKQYEYYRDKLLDFKDAGGGIIC